LTTADTVAVDTFARFATSLMVAIPCRGVDRHPACLAAWHGTTSAADPYLLTAFAAVFLGSATLRDAEFHVFGTFIGALIIAFGFNGLDIFGAPTYSQYIFQGATLIIAVGLSSLGRILSQR
jgi:ribose/xylose/arabinose/galactoside ABC-type transport system permease subunit